MKQSNITIRNELFLLTTITDAILVVSSTVLVIHWVTGGLGYDFIAVKAVKETVLRGTRAVTDPVSKHLVTLDAMCIGRAVLEWLKSYCTLQVVKGTGVAIAVLLKYRNIVDITYE